MNYVVYVWKHPVTQRVVYVGAGKKGRETALSNQRAKRTDVWMRENGRPVVEVIGLFDTKDEALAFEADTIRLHDDGTLLNVLGSAFNRSSKGDARRSRTLRARRAEAGLAQFNVWLPREQHPELKHLIEMLTKNPGLRVVSVACQDAKTGRMKGIRLR